MNQTLMFHPHKAKVSATVDDGNCLTIVVDGERISDCSTLHIWLRSLAEIEAIGKSIIAEVARIEVARIKAGAMPSDAEILDAIDFGKTAEQHLRY